VLPGKPVSATAGPYTTQPQQQDFRFVSGHDFSPAVKGPEESGALAPAQFSIRIHADFPVPGAKAPTILAAEWHDWSRALIQRQNPAAERSAVEGPAVAFRENVMQPLKSL
jgi:hypothetical protein